MWISEQLPERMTRPSHGLMLPAGYRREASPDMGEMQAVSDREPSNNVKPQETAQHCQRADLSLWEGLRSEPEADGMPMDR